MSVTAQMKTFLDRSLAFGHKPRSTWKPGLAVSVSAGLGESGVVQYLASTLRIFGAFSAGTFTAMAAGPGEFVGKEAVEARSQDLARDLARAIKEKRRYPATEMDLRYYHFMGNLVKTHKDTVMKDDYAHWQTQGLFEGFEHYIQQDTAQVPFNREARDAWIKQMIRDHKEKKSGERPNKREPSQGPHSAETCRELLEIMPKGFNASAAEGLSAIYQFEVSGDETFVAQLRIAEGTCTYENGPAHEPDVVIKTPARVWLSIARGELDGQQAFMNGQYKVDGDLGLLMRLRSLFSG
jgi:putative sterol carrier protein